MQFCICTSELVLSTSTVKNDKDQSHNGHPMHAWKNTDTIESSAINPNISNMVWCHAIMFCFLYQRRLLCWLHCRSYAVLYIMWNIGTWATRLQFIDGTAAHGFCVDCLILSVKVGRFGQDTLPRGSHMASRPILSYPTLSCPIQCSSYDIAIISWIY